MTSTDQEEALETRPLGATGLHTTALGMGTWGLAAQSYGPLFGDQATRTLQRAVAQGVRTFDMAPTWGDGAAEELVAEALGERREEALYITRAGRVATEHGLEAAFTPEALRADCEGSLNRLRTDRVDVWLLHNPDVDTLAKDEVRETAEALLKEGKVRAWGASVADAAGALAALDAGVQVLCLPVSLMRPDLLWGLEAQLKEREVGVIARSVLAHGLLTGRWAAGRRFGPEDHRTQRWNPDALAARVQHVNGLRYLVRGHVLSMAAAALRFALSEPTVSCALVGARTPGHVEAALHGVRKRPYLPDEDRARLRRELPRT